MPRHDYYTKDGVKQPGASTIAGMLSKGEPLMNWAHKLGWEQTLDWIEEEYKKPHITEQLGKDVLKLTLPDYEEIGTWQSKRDRAGKKGTDVHKLIVDFINGEEVVMPSDNVANRCFKNFQKWWVKEIKDGDCTKIITEKPFVSEKLRFGGTADVVMVDKKKLIDIKTGGKTLYDKKGRWIHDDWLYQLAGYDLLLEEHGYEIEEYQILWLPKVDKYAYPIWTDLENEKEIFKYLLRIYKLRREQ